VPVARAHALRAFWPQKLFVVLVLLASVGLLPLFHPRSLWWILGAFSVHFVSGFEHMFGFRYHYHLVPLALLFVASIYGIAAIQNGTGPLVRIGGRWRSLSIAAAVALVLSLNGMLPLFSARLFWPTPTSRAIVSEVVAIESQLPADYAVYATHELVPYLVPHARLRQFNGKPQRHSGSFFDTSEPHVVVLTTEPLALALPDRPVLELMDEYAAKNGYRVEMPSPHLRLYWSTATP